MVSSAESEKQVQPSRPYREVCRLIGTLLYRTQSIHGSWRTICSAESHAFGRRITVLDVYDHVQEGSGDLTPREFAEMFQLGVADVYHALAYYHSHTDEMVRQEEARVRASRDLRDRVEQDRPTGIDPPD